MSAARPRSSQFGHAPRATSGRAPSSSTAKKTSIVGLLGLDTLLLQRENEAIDAARDSDRRRRRAADLLDQVVVATAAGQRELRAERIGHELERRARVVVEPADEGRHEPVLDPVGVQVAADRVEVRLALVAQRLADLRSLRERALDLLRLLGQVVEHAQRARLALRERVLVEFPRVLVEPGIQLLEIRGPAVSVADRVQLEPGASDPEASQELVEELDHLRIDGGVVGAHRLDVELPELAVLPTLGRRVAIDRADEERLHRLRLAVEAVLDVRARDRRGRLRPQRQRRSPRSVNVYISFWTMSEPSPDVRVNSSVSSNSGVVIRR